MHNIMLYIGNSVNFEHDRLSGVYNNKNIKNTDVYH